MSSAASYIEAIGSIDMISTITGVVLSHEQMAATKEAQALDYKLALMKRDDELKEKRENMLFGRQQLQQQKQLTMAQLGQQQRQFQQTQVGHELQNRLSHLNSLLFGNTQIQNNLANLWRRK